MPWTTRPAGRPDAQSLPGCYRHPDRETGIRCTRCERPICHGLHDQRLRGLPLPRLRRRPRTGAGGLAPSASRPRTLAGGTVAADPSLVTKILIGINVAVFIAVQALPASFLTDLVLIGRWPPPPSSRPRGRRGGRVVPPGDHDVHPPGDLAHRLQHDHPVVPRRPPGKPSADPLLPRSTSSPAWPAASAPTCSRHPPRPPSAPPARSSGSSAPPPHRCTDATPDLRPVVILLVISLIFTFTRDNISWQAHVGGLVAGAVIGWAMLHAPRERRTLVQYGTCALVSWSSSD